MLTLVYPSKNGHAFGLFLVIDRPLFFVARSGSEMPRTNNASSGTTSENTHIADLANICILSTKIVRIQNLGPQFVAARCLPRMAHKMCIIRAKGALKRHVVTADMVIKRCRLSRTCTRPSDGDSSVPGQGEPLTLLPGWLTGSKLPQCEELW